MSTRIIIIGAGTGGLCLAQGLKLCGLSVLVCERDKHPTDRLQGYRLHISTEGSQALENCLPPHLFQMFLESAAKPTIAVSFLDSQLRTLLTIPVDPGQPNAPREVPISRITLRKLLLNDLEGIVRFGRKFVFYEELQDGRLVVHFEDGSQAECDVLVGADGASSGVRKQLLPEAKRLETGIVTITGKAFLSDRLRSTTPDAFFRGPTLILGPKGQFLFGSAVEFPARDNRSTSDSDSKASASSEDLLFGERVEYAMWGFSARQEVVGDPEEVQHCSGQELKSKVLALTRGWHPQLRAVIDAAAPETISAFAIKSAVRIKPWATRKVTLLGDALHNMTPYRGMGANMALVDSDALRRTLLSVNRAERELIPALHDYEAEMIERGFRAVEASLNQMKQVHNESSVANVFRFLFFRAVDRLPVRIKKSILNHR